MLKIIFNQITLFVIKNIDLEKRFAEEFLESEHRRERETSEARLKTNSEK
jgi:hypothetical protein